MPRPGAEPGRFDPDRWAPGRREAVPRSAYVPFGAGPRLCIGREFALAEGVLLLAAIAQRWTLDAGRPARRVGRSRPSPCGRAGDCRCGSYGAESCTPACRPMYREGSPRSVL